MDSSARLDNIIDKALETLEEKDYISIFFLLMDFISPKEYFAIIKMDRCQKENWLKKILKCTREEWQTFLEILKILQKNSLLKILNSCVHKVNKMNESFDKISPLWKVMYRVCELTTSTKDFTALKQLLPGVESYVEPEIILVHAYKEEIFTDYDLTKLSSVFRKEKPDISAILDMYNGKVCNIRYYALKTPTRSSPCGLAVIVNHKYFWDENDEDSTVLERREGSIMDIVALKKVWDMFGFDTKVYDDLTDEEVINLFKQLAKTDHTSYDIFVCCYMSHGADGVVFTSNSKPIWISDLVDIISNNCCTLVNKPKLFFIEACQGSQIQKGISSKPVKLPSPVFLETKIESNTPLNSDVLKVISSIPGYTSFTVPGNMSWFVQSLESKMKKYGKYLDIIDIVVKVQDEVSQRIGIVSLPDVKIINCKQTVMYQSTLRRRLKLKHMFLD